MSFYLDNAAIVEKRLNNPKNLLSEAGYKVIGQGQNSNSRGTTLGTKYRKLSPETKGLVGALAKISGVKETSKTFGISPVVTSALKRGMTQNGTKADTEVRKETKSVLDSLGVQASNVVQESLARLLNSQRLNDAKTSELATVAGIAMNIFEKTQPKRPESFQLGRIVFMVPQSREVSDYSIIDVESVRE
jgi:hypothetical protein